MISVNKVRGWLAESEKGSSNKLEGGENPNDWTVSFGWASVGKKPVHAVVLIRDGAVRAFTVGQEGPGYAVIEATEG